MTALTDAVERYLSVIAAHHNLRELEQGTAEFHGQLATATTDDVNAALRTLLPVVRKVPLVPAGFLVITCGACIERGGDPDICGEAILGRLPELLRGVAGFLGEVRRRANVGPDERVDLNQLINQHINDVLGTNPAFAWAYIAQRSLSLGAIAHLSRSKKLRAIARSRPELLQLSVAADRAAGNGSFLTDMLRVLDDERLVVLHPGEMKGFEVRISGIADNFQLHTLLADAVIGNPADGYLGGTKPDPAVVAIARGGAIPTDRLTARGMFNLWNWPALQSDGTLPHGAAGGGWWIWNEGNPGDIRHFDGVRVVLLSPPPYARSWNAGRRFPHMPGELTVERVLTADAAGDWLARITVAAKPELPPA